MPTRLLREPHLLAHELRTPLSVLAGWWSLVAEGDVSRDSPHWDQGMAVCREAIDRLNFVIKAACDEASDRRLARDRETIERAERLRRQTEEAIEHSWRVLMQIRASQQVRLTALVGGQAAGSTLSRR